MSLFRKKLHYTKSTHFPHKFYFFIIDKVSLRTGWNGSAKRIWPAGRSLQTNDLHHDRANFGSWVECAPPRHFVWLAEQPHIRRWYILPVYVEGTLSTRWEFLRFHSKGFMRNGIFTQAEVTIVAFILC